MQQQFVLIFFIVTVSVYVGRNVKETFGLVVGTVVPCVPLRAVASFTCQPGSILFFNPMCVYTSFLDGSIFVVMCNAYYILIVCVCVCVVNIYGKLDASPDQP